MSEVTLIQEGTESAAKWDRFAKAASEAICRADELSQLEQSICNAGAAAILFGLYDVASKLLDAALKVQLAKREAERERETGATNG